MSPVTKQIVEMIDMLPEQEQQLAFECIKRMVLAWDNDFVKVTSLEREKLMEADKEILDGEIIDHNDVGWN